MISSTSNETHETIAGEIKSEGIELGPVAPGGGVGFAQNAPWEYREIDNANPGFWFFKGGSHLPLGTAQATYVSET